MDLQARLQAMFDISVIVSLLLFEIIINIWYMIYFLWIIISLRSQRGKLITIVWQVALEEWKNQMINDKWQGMSFDWLTRKTMKDDWWSRRYQWKQLDKQREFIQWWCFHYAKYIPLMYIATYILYILNMLYSVWSYGNNETFKVFCYWNYNS